MALREWQNYQTLRTLINDQEGGVRMRYYEVIIGVTCLYMFMQLVHLAEDEALTRKERKFFGLIATCVIIGTICEYLGVFLNNKSLDFRMLHGLVKTIEFSVAPCIPILYCFAVDFNKKKRIRKILISTLLVINTICEVISMFTPFIFHIDSNNVYLHGKYYFIYIFYYMGTISYFIYIFLKSAKQYQNKGIKSLISIILFFLIGFIITKVDSNIKIDWLIVSMEFSAFLNYYSKLVLKIDALTLLLNRRSYENQLKKINFETVIIRLDVNNFKKINDTYGHQCGDTCLKIIASAIIEAYGKVGWCYRTGGDEFDVILKPGKLNEIISNTKYRDIYRGIDNLNNSFDEVLSRYFDEYPMLKDGVSKGYGIFYGYMDSSNAGMQDKRFSAGIISDVIEIADKRMYEGKRKMKN